MSPSFSQDHHQETYCAFYFIHNFDSSILQLKFFSCKMFKTFSPRCTLNGYPLELNYPLFLVKVSKKHKLYSAIGFVIIQSNQETRYLSSQKIKSQAPLDEKKIKLVWIFCLLYAPSKRALPARLLPFTDEGETGILLEDKSSSNTFPAFNWAGSKPLSRSIEETLRRNQEGFHCPPPMSRSR